MKDYKSINQLPDINKCKRIFQSAAMLDAILMPEWEYRYYSYNSKWDTNEQMASMRDGQGNQYFALLSNYGLIIKGFDVDYLRSNKNNYYDNIYDEVPDKFKDFLSEPAFTLEKATFCIWNEFADGQWKTSIETDIKSLRLLKILLGGPEYYLKWANEYYDIILPSNIVEYIFDFNPINLEILKLLNKDIDLRDIKVDIEEIGYPYDKDIVNAYK